MRTPLLVRFSSLPRRPPKKWGSAALESWKDDEEHGKVPRAYWYVAVGNPMFWVACFILAHCSTHVLLGWPDGSLVWVLTTVFERAASFCLSHRGPETGMTYPPKEPRRRGQPVGFQQYVRDLRTLCRHYVLPGPTDLAKVKRRKPSTTAVKWNVTIGTPLGELSPSQGAGRPRYLAGWPAFHRLLVVLDDACMGRTSRGVMCDRCNRSSHAPYFTMVALEMEHAKRTGTAAFPDRYCARWGAQCRPPVDLGELGLRIVSAVVDPPSTARSTSVAASLPSMPTPRLEDTAPTTAVIEEESRLSLPRPLEEQLREAQRELAELKRKQREADAPAYTPLPAGGAMFLPPTGPELSNLDNQQVIKAWLYNVQQFCSRMQIPLSHQLGWAISGLKGAAATSWAALTYSMDLSSMTLKEMGDLLMRHFYQKYSMLALWGRWAGLQQHPSETAQAYSERVKQLLGQEEFPDRWAAAAFIAGIKEPIRTRFYKTLPADRDRSFTLDEVSQLFVRFELTQSTLRGGKGPTSGKRPADESAALPRKKAVPGSGPQYWICGAKHPY